MKQLIYSFKYHFMNLKPLTLLLRAFLIIFSIVSIVFTTINGQLVLLPSTFLICYLISICFFKIKTNLMNIIVLGIMFIRFLLIPMMYFVNNPMTGAIYSYYINFFTLDYDYINLVFSIECIALFTALIFANFIYYKKMYPKLKKNYDGLKFSRAYRSNRKHLIFLIVGLGIIPLIILYPQFIPLIKIGSLPPNSLYSVFHVCLTSLFFYLVNFLLNKIKNDYLCIALELLLFVCYLIPVALQTNGISRNLLIITTVSFFVFLLLNFRRYKAFFIILLLGSLVIGFSLLTVIRSTDMYIGPGMILATIAKYLNYGTLNAYFAGPTNYQYAMNYMTQMNVHGLDYLVYDSCANVTFLNHLFTTNTNTEFNQFVYRGVAVMDIIPTGSQSTIYFGPAFSWLLPFGFLFLGSLLFLRISNRRKGSIFTLFPLIYISTVLCMAQIINVNAIFMLITIKVLPLFLVLFADILFDKLLSFIQRKRNKQISSEIVDENDKEAVKKVQTKKNAINYAFNLFHQLVLVVVPLVTTPYISQVLLSAGIGQYNFAFSIASYFVIIANLGLGYYAERTIAKSHLNKEEQSKKFYEIMMCKVIFTAISLVLYGILLITNIFKDYQTLLLILGLEILGSAFDVSFYFKGNEGFKTVALLQSFVKLLSMAFIFLFVKSSNDVWIYTLIMALTTLGTYLILIPYAKKTLIKPNFKELKIKQHIKPALFLFIPTICGLFYTMFLKILLGILPQGYITQIIGGMSVISKLSEVETGYFSQADKVVQMVLTLVTSLGAVMSIRNSTVLSEGKNKEFKENINNTMTIALMLAIPTSLGLAFITPHMTPWFFGEGYEKVNDVMLIYAFLIPISGLGNVFGYQYLVAKEKDKRFAVGTAIGAVLAIGIGIPLISSLYSIGAAITSLICEASVLTFFIISARKDINFKEVLKKLWKYLIAGGALVAVVLWLRRITATTVLGTIFIVLVAAIVYFLILILFNETSITGIIKNSYNRIKKSPFFKY